MALVTITDISKKAQVSRSTVVRVIQNKGYVSADKRQIIERVIQELGYVPNKIAQGLKNKSTMMIGHIMPMPYPNPFFAQISNAIERKAFENGYNVLTRISYGNEQKEKEMLEDLLGRMVDGIILTSTNSSDYIKKMVNLNVPIIMIERADMAGVDKILIDDLQGAREATSYLIACGHRKIAFIGHQPTHNVENRRMEGYLSVIKKVPEFSPDRWMRLVKDYEPEDGYNAAKSLVESEFKPTAVLMGSDIFAVGALQYFYEKKIRVPDDISVIGYDDTYASVLAPRLSTVALPMQQIGEMAVKRIIERSKNEIDKFKTLTVQPYLIKRNSVKVLN